MEFLKRRISNKEYRILKSSLHDSAVSCSTFDLPAIVRLRRTQARRACIQWSQPVAIISENSRASNMYRDQPVEGEEILRLPGNLYLDFLVEFRKAKPLKVRKGHLAQWFEIRGVVKEGNDPLVVPVNEQIGASGVLLNTPEVTVVQAQQSAAYYFVRNPVGNQDKILIFMFSQKIFQTLHSAVSDLI
jgi:hypothetical protein